MQMIKAVYLNELFKISKKKKIVVSALLCVFSVVVASLIVMSVGNLMGISMTASSEFPILVLPVLINTLVPLFTAFIAIDMFTGEFSNDTIKSTLLVPVSRLKIYTGKILALASFIIANLLFIMVTSSIVSLFIKGFSLGIGKILLTYLASFFPLLIFALMVAFIANIAKGSGSAFMLTILVFLVFKAFELIFSQCSSFFFTSTFDFYILFTGLNFNIQKIFRVLMILSGYGIMLFTAGFALFDKKEV